jgi:hypothetical protein
MAKDTVASIHPNLGQRDKAVTNQQGNLQGNQK